MPVLAYRFVFFPPTNIKLDVPVFFEKPLKDFVLEFLQPHCLINLRMYIFSWYFIFIINSSS